MNSKVFLHNDDDGGDDGDDDDDDGDDGDDGDDDGDDGDDDDTIWWCLMILNAIAFNIRL